MQTISDLPVLSSYIMSMPLTGSYYGFLTLVSTNGLEMNYKQLERNYAMLNDVKTWARKFVREHSIRISSNNAVVQHSIRVARGEKQQSDNMKEGVKDRMGKIACGVIETAVGNVARRG